MDEVSEARTKRFLAGFANVGTDEWLVQRGPAADPVRFPAVAADYAEFGLDAGPHACARDSGHCRMTLVPALLRSALALILTFTVTIVHLVLVALTNSIVGRPIVWRFCAEARSLLRSPQLTPRNPAHRPALSSCAVRSLQ